MYRVADIMTRKLVTLREADDLALADSILALGRFRHLPVVDERMQLRGLITHRDLLRIWAERTGVDGRMILAGEVMRKEPMTASPDMPLFEAARWMYENKFGCLPVVEQGRLVGIVTEADFLQIAAQLAEASSGPFREAHQDSSSP